MYTSKTCFNHSRTRRGNDYKRMHFPTIGAALVIAFLFGTTAYAQDKTDEIGKIFSWATPATPGCAQPYALTEADLKGFAGRYQSDEIGAFFDITPGKDVLKGRANDAPGEGLTCKPVDRNLFQLACVTLRFLRDKVGNVVALDFSNPVVRNIKFKRLKDPTSLR